jgi:hypothetical protein
VKEDSEILVCDIREFEVDEAGLKSGGRRGYIEVRSGKNDIAESWLVSV